VPAEFAHPALQELVRIGKTHGSVDSEQLRVALVQAEISPKRMKVVLRSLDHQGIHVTLDAATGTSGRCSCHGPCHRDRLRDEEGRGEQGEGGSQAGREDSQGCCRQEAHRQEGGARRESLSRLSHQEDGGQKAVSKLVAEAAEVKARTAKVAKPLLLVWPKRVDAEPK